MIILIDTDILQVYSYYLLTATYGNIPYSEAENPSIPFPKYDDAKTVYSDLLVRLDTCLAGINTAGAAMGNADQIYKGDAAKWKKFAAPLKLKIAMLVADVDLAATSKKVLEAVATEVFQSNSDNALFNYFASPTSSTNLVWQALINSGRHDFGPTNILINTMSQWSDPRLPLYFTQYPAGGIYWGSTGRS
ncbi:MAG: hypothetical protein JWN76_3308 [Chitinophagaceae bacterium]|nr:hypothetical protein [Chitinophagaceae bacterium]